MVTKSCYARVRVRVRVRVRARNVVSCFELLSKAINDSVGTE